MAAATAAAPPRLNNPSLLIGQNYINGTWLEAASGRRFQVTDPANGNTIGTCPESDSTDAHKAIDAAAAALPAWRSRTGRNRGRILRRWYELVMENQQDLATLITWENGKATPDAAGEVLFAASFLEWFAEEAARIYGDVLPHSQPGFRVAVIKEPVGVCGLITPWNFPAAMITRKLGPALAAGCTVVVKTAGETPFTANALIRLGAQAGIPAGVVNSVTALANTAEIGQALCASTTVRKISFTGSTRVGKLLMRQSSDSVKKLSLELGGNAPFIVFDDADLDLAVDAALASKFKSSGQTCVCSNRLFVQKGIYPAFLRRLKDAVARFRVGNGFDRKTTHGPLVTAAAVDRVAGLVEDAVRRGASVEMGGKKRLDLGPNFYEPTILTNVTADMSVVTDEIFGPVAPIFAFDREEEVIAASNACEVGLASYLFTQDVTRASRVAELLQFGMVAVNTGIISDAASPFGGIKHSGMGREGSKYGIEDYLETKTLVTGNIHVVHRAVL
ncbi:putative succinate-semialdehyde dehydrogenase [Aspergillus japonicus CBS 114.51]|uniref:Succinate-semialdehyde dehydrogenase n=1 Tax=Aspergillus japonicus CBS 114.51 TaxID=1448312 RepID=A0A8T8X069_ASPJA|nr:putative succinate-semialdehyde dehydrogenase [Aspergillus japonicus CBS 114.51]RAH81527.1 putative succinate-semialdehyde dehydrogenase [Aspergillus japonicus CBS 114.51]